jgi:hypothetical protein
MDQTSSAAAAARRMVRSLNPIAIHLFLAGRLTPWTPNSHWARLRRMRTVLICGADSLAEELEHTLL